MSDVDVKVICANCKYFVGDNAVLGSCKRYPQSINKHKKDWCGEYVWALKEYRDELSQFFKDNPVERVEDLIEKVKKRGRKPKNAASA